MTLSDSSVANTTGPNLLRKGSHDMLSAPLVLDFETIHEGKAGENEEEKQELADSFSSPNSSPPLTLQSYPSPASTVHTTPDWSTKAATMTSSSTTAAATSSPAIKKAKSSQGLGSRTSASSSSALTGAIAATVRPLYHDRANSAGSSSTGGSPSQAHRSALRRQLMPAIPTRKESVTQTSEGQVSTGKNSSNIQSLAQAIAARAQHVAAANAMARAGMYPKSSAGTSAAKGLSHTPSSNAAVTEADGINEAQSSKDVDGLMEAQIDGVALASAIRISEDPETGGASSVRVDPLLDPLEGGPRIGDPRDKRRGAGRMRESVYSNYSQDSYRWSQADWILADESLNGHAEPKDGTSTEDNDSNGTSNGKLSVTHDSEHSTAQTSHFDDKISAAGHDVPQSVSVLGKRSSNQSRISSSSAEGLPERAPLAVKVSKGVGMAGLGIQEGLPGLLADPAPIVSKSSPTAATRSSDYYAIASEGMQNDAYEGPLLSPAAIVSSPPSTTVSPRNSGVRRKSKPAALSLNLSPNMSVKSPSTASLARSMASPTLRSKTPPPTLPPAEPLPPIPVTPSSVYRKSLTRSSQPASPRVENGLEQSNPLMAAFAALASSEQEPRKRQGSEPSLATMSHLRLTSFDESDASTSMRRRLSSKGATARENTAARSVAANMVSANHASTLAGVESAQAVLDEVTPEQSYDENRSYFQSTTASKRAGKHASDPVVSPSRRRSEGGKRVSKQKQASPLEQAAVHHDNEGKQETGGKVSSNAIVKGDNEKETEGDNEDLEEEDEDEEAEEAVVTRVLSVNGPASVLPSSQPMLIRRDSAPLVGTGAKAAVTPLSGTASESAAAAADPSSMVARMRAQIEGRHNDDVKKAEGKTEAASMSLSSSSSSAQTPAIATAKSADVEKVEAMREPAAPTASQIEAPAATANTPAASTNHSDFGVASSNNAHSRNHQSGNEEERHTDSTGHALVARVKATGGFDEISTAFKQLQAEKKMLEKVIRSTTPLSGIGDSQDLSHYLTSMANKLDMSTAEIRRLLDLLDQQRSVMDYMVETHQLELDAYVTEVDELNEDIEDVTMEADTHRMNCIRLTEDLDRAHAEVIAARAETLRYRSMMAEEEGKRERYAELLRRAKEDVLKMQRERDDALRTAGVQIDHRRGTQGGAAQTENGESRVGSPLSDRMSPLLRPRSRSNLRAKGWVQTSESGSADDWQTEKAALQAELRESRKLQIESERLLHEYKSTSHGRGQEELSTGSLSPLLAGPSEVEEALRDKLVQQEKDIAELRAAVALGGASGGPNEDKLASLPTGRANQVQMLMGDLADTRAREAQIRTAYKQLRDDMRKVQLAQQQDRKRSQARFSYLAAGSASPASSHGHGGAGESSNQTTSAGPPTAWQGMAMPSDPSSPASPATSRQLKRLSLPLVSKQLGGLTLSGDTVNVPSNSSHKNDNNDNSSATSRLAASPLHRRGSRNYSNDGHTPLNAKRTSWLGMRINDDNGNHEGLGSNSLGSILNHALPPEQVESLK